MERRTRTDEVLLLRVERAKVNSLQTELTGSKERFKPQTGKEQDARAS